jgi:hypothetical protein
VSILNARVSPWWLVPYFASIGIAIVVGVITPNSSWWLVPDGISIAVLIAVVVNARKSLLT